MCCYNAVIADARVPPASDIQTLCSILSPELALPSGSHATTTRSHGALHILGTTSSCTISVSQFCLNSQFEVLSFQPVSQSLFTLFQKRGRVKLYWTQQQSCSLEQCSVSVLSFTKRIVSDWIWKIMKPNYCLWQTNMLKGLQAIKFFSLCPWCSVCRLSWHTGCYAGTEDGCGQCWGRDPGCDEGLL